jgi:hypothetical protein
MLLWDLMTKSTYTSNQFMFSFGFSLLQVPNLVMKALLVTDTVPHMF